MSGLPDGPQGGGSSIDTPALRALFGDKRVWFTQAKVTGDPINDDDEGVVDVPVELWPSGVAGHAQLLVPFGGDGYGEWSHPAVGSLVGVLCAQAHEGDGGAWFICGAVWNKGMKKPTGSAAGKHRIVTNPGDDREIEVSGGGKLKITITGNGTPSIEINTAEDIQIIATGKTIDLQAETVQATAAGSGALSLATKADLEAAIATINTNVGYNNLHTHQVVDPGGSGTWTSGLPTPTQGTAASPAGTSVLLGE